ncbi:MAG: AAA family ATPase [Myxococcota bacterium]|nr:AAA family ATPase [Myxococcota bacterium]
MYTAFYGLGEKPFSLTPNPAFLYLSDSHREALAHLVYGLEQGEGFIVLAGEVGTGKTTLCRSLLERIEGDSEIAILFNPSNNDIELLQSISEEFGLVAEERSRRQLLSALNTFLLDCHGRDRRVVLIVDEAQNLSIETLEQIRLLSNLETTSSKLIQIILMGQPELETKLDSDALRQLRQRVTVRWSLRAFSVKDTAAYVQHRLYVAAGAERDIFTPAALREIHRLTGGIPRLINVLCDRALLVGYAEGGHRVGTKWVRQAAREVPDAARRVGVAGSSRRFWALAACLLLAVVAGLGLGLGRWGFVPGWERASDTVLAPVASARQAVLPGELKNPQPPGGSVTVIVELPPAGANATAGVAELAVAVPGAFEPQGGDGSASRLEPAAEAAFLEAVLLGQSSEAAVDSATRATLALHGIEFSGEAIDSADQAISEVRLQGLGALDFGAENFVALLDLNYPALLGLAAGSETRWVALVGVEGDEGYLMGLGTESPLRISLETLESHWDGGAWVIWNPYVNLPNEISEGSRGVGVLWLQDALSRLGYLGTHMSGVFDQASHEGVMRFQGEHAVAADGVAGPRTQMLIYSALDEFAPPQLEDRDSG